MSKKLNKNIIFILILIGVISMVFIMNSQYKAKAELYSDQASIKQLNQKLKESQDLYVYYYQVNCEHCKRVSPFLIPLAKKQGKEFTILNLEKYPDGWNQMFIMETPTLIYYRNGQEFGRIEGEHTEEEYKNFFKKY